jgi:hypothetical protein
MSKRLTASPATINELLAVSRMVDRRNPPEYCGLPKCARTRVGRNLCRAHYLQLWRWAKETGTDLNRDYTFTDLRGMERPARGNALRSAELNCVVCGLRVYARGFCQHHYNAWYKTVLRGKKEKEN